MIIRAPTPIEIENVLDGIMPGTSVFARWARGDDGDLGGSLWWADVLSPANQLLACVGGGPTPSEAAAAAWIDFCLWNWWSDGETCSRIPTHDEYLSVPRRVPEGWGFDLYAAPETPPAVHAIQ